jgi:6-phosphogluconolactonase
VTAYRLDRASGTLSGVGTTRSLPEGVTVRNTCSQIHLTPTGRFLYVGNRGHNSIAGFAVDPAGCLTPAGHAATEAVPPRSVSIRGGRSCAPRERRPDVSPRTGSTVRPAR